jgi:MFS transporter, FSR family, fosmidomycin resistance protein
MKMNKKALSFLSIGHLVTDLNPGALPALLPFFKEVFQLSYTMSGLILLFGNLTSSFIQPAFGYLSDRRPMKWLLVLAPLVASLGMSMTGWVPNYILLVLCVIVSGIGVASYHPEGFKTAHFFTGDKKVTGMSMFMVGGNLGMALGPMWAMMLVTSLGLKGTLGMIVPGMIIAGILFHLTSQPTAPIHSVIGAAKGERPPLQRKQLLSLLLLISIVILRAWIQFGLTTYIPFYYIDFLKSDPLIAGKLISTFLTAGALGTVLGAPLADRWGHKNFLLATIALTVPLLILFYNSTGWVAFVTIAIAGMMVVSPHSVLVVMAQALLPHNLGMASGLMVGFAMGAGGLGVTLLGTVADIWGVPTALKSIVLLPMIGFGLSLLVEYPPKKEGDSGR